MKSPLLLLASAISSPWRLRRTAEEAAAVILALRAEGGPPPFPSARKDKADPRPPLLPAAAARLLEVAAAVLPELFQPTRAAGVLGTAAGFVAQGLVFSCPADASILLLLVFSMFCRRLSLLPPVMLVLPQTGLASTQRAHANSLLNSRGTDKDKSILCISYVTVMSECQDRHSEQQRRRDIAGAQKAGRYG